MGKTRYRKYGDDMRRDAEEVFLSDLTLDYADVARVLDIKESQVKYWGNKHTWQKKRLDRIKFERQLQSDHEAGLARLGKVIRSDKATSQDYYAFKLLADSRWRQRYDDLIRIMRENESGGKADRPKLFLEALDFVIDVLRDVDQEALKRLERYHAEIIRRFKALEHDSGD